MPCYHPLQIRNNKPDKNPLVDKAVLTVPCGKCYNCKSEKRLSWFIRLYYEWQHCVDNHGFVYFLTLTYNNKNCPVINGHRVFDKKHVQNYFKRVRKTLETILPKYDWKGNIKYFLSSEYGGKTHRPHYHLLWFVPFNCPQYIVGSILSSCWGLGFTKFGSRNSGIVDSVGGLHYCAKYVCKDVYEDNWFKKLAREFKDEPKEYLNRAFPFHTASNNLGMYLLSCMDYSDLENGEVLMPDSLKVFKRYKLPLYYDRKIFYDTLYKFYDLYSHTYVYVNSKSQIPNDVEYTPVYVLNDSGIEMKRKRFERYVISARNKYRLFENVPSDFSVFLVNYKFQTKFQNVQQIKDFVKRHLSEERYISFNCVYRGLYSTYSMDDELNDYSSYSDDYTTMLDIKAGYRPLSAAMLSLTSNCNYYNKNSNIQFCSDLVDYIYFLCQKTFEDMYNKQELEYVDSKTLFLRYNEKVS